MIEVSGSATQQLHLLREISNNEVNLPNAPGPLHETRDESQELQAAPRLLTEGEPVECEQQAVESVVSAECMNKTWRSTEWLHWVKNRQRGPVMSTGDETVSGGQTWF